MKELQEQITGELQAIVKVIESVTGLPSRWSGKLELVADAEFKGKKPFRCDVFLDAALAATPERWSTLIHEALHTGSAGYVREDYQDFQGWEEGVVEQLQRLLRAEVLARLHVTVEETVFASIDAGHAYNDFIAAIERLRRILDDREEAEAVTAFYLQLLTTPIKRVLLCCLHRRRDCKACQEESLSCNSPWQIQCFVLDARKEICHHETLLNFNQDYLLDPERQCVLNQVLDARSLEEIDAARQSLRDWLLRHPEDTGMREAFGGLSLLEDIAREQKAERENAASLDTNRLQNLVSRCRRRQRRGLRLRGRD